MNIGPEGKDTEKDTEKGSLTTDMLINKVLRSLDAVEYIDGGTVLEFTPLLKTVIERLNVYCTRYLGDAT